MGSLHFLLTHIGTRNQTTLIVSRQRLGVRQPSAAFGASGGAESARGLAQSKTWRSFPAALQKIRLVDERFMEGQLSDQLNAFLSAPRSAQHEDADSE